MGWTRHLWDRHPHVRSDGELTVGERAADKMRNGMGSWAFVFIALAFLTMWMSVNGLIAASHSHTFDPYPFILLNLVLSCVAALQGAILLIAAKRQDQISSELAVHDFDVNKASLEYQVNLAFAINALCESQGVTLPDNVKKILLDPTAVPVPIKLMSLLEDDRGE